MEENLLYFHSLSNWNQVNPLFGLRDDYSLFTWIARNNGIEYHELIAEILDSALQRRSGERNNSIEDRN
jgi:hypothetical protein